MADKPRRTIARPVAVAGNGLHSGQPVTTWLRPGRPGEGIVVRRVDLPRAPTIPATLQAVDRAERQTVLASGDACAATVEHCLAAVHAWGIDDLEIALDAPELPAVDGSAGPWVEALRQAGCVSTSGPRRQCTVAEPVELRVGEARYRAEPSDVLLLDVTIEWDHPAIGCQRGSWQITPETFARELAPARTFGFIREAAELAARALACGATGSNTILLDDDGVISGPLRFPDEFVRHKALDLVGDLALIGSRLGMAVTAVRPSHRHNLALARLLARHAIAQGVGHGHPGHPEDPAASLSVPAR